MLVGEESSSKEFALNDSSSSSVSKSAVRAALDVFLSSNAVHRVEPHISPQKGRADLHPAKSPPYVLGQSN